MSRFILLFVALWGAVYFFPAETKSACAIGHKACSDAIDYVWAAPAYAAVKP